MNKKIVILVVIVECILAVLLVAIVGKAIEASYTERMAEEIYVTTHDGIVLAAGDKYIEKENKVEKIDSQLIVIEVTRWDRGYQLNWLIKPDNTSDKSVSFIAESEKETYEVSVNEAGFVYFEGETNATITLSTKNGKTITILLVPRTKQKTGDVEID